MKIEMGASKPERFTESWPGEYAYFSHFEHAAVVPEALCMITTRKENGMPNAAFHSGMPFSGDGAHYHVMLANQSRLSHTNGDDYIAMDVGFESEPVEVRDGQIYFMLDGSREDITDRCSEDSYFAYEQQAANGRRHVIIVGGTLDTVGWAEFLWDKNGNDIGCNATYRGEQEPVWLQNARTDFCR